MKVKFAAWLLLMLFGLHAEAAVVKGDVNGDGNITISDVSALVYSIMNSTTTLVGDVNGDGNVTVADVSALVALVLKGTDPHANAAVDLGLSVLWASYNVGASSPEEYGNYYSWGETSPKSDYSESAYLYYSNYSYQNIGTDICGTAYDAVTVNWAYDWRMPTLAEVNELLTDCTWSKDTENGVAGYRVTGPSGNRIFLPLAGLYMSSAATDAGTRGYLWTGTLDAYSAAYTLNTLGYVGNWTCNRHYGLPVRGVKAK